MNCNFIEEINICSDRPVLIVSDIHLGQSSIEQEAQLLNTLIHLSETYSIIINGDMFEMWEYGRFGWKTETNMEKFSAIWEMHKALLTKLLIDTPDVYYIHGNHDFLLSTNDTPFKVYRRIVLREKDHKCGQILIIHGNDADGYSNANMIKKIKYILASGFAYTAHKVQHFFGCEPTKKANIADIIYVGMGREKKYISYAKTLGYRHVIFGHTHQLGAVFTNDFFYYNTGCCLLHIQGVCINGNDIFLRVWPFEGPPH